MEIKNIELKVKTLNDKHNSFIYKKFVKFGRNKKNNILS